MVIGNLAIISFDVVMSLRYQYCPISYTFPENFIHTNILIFSEILHEEVKWPLGGPIVKPEANVSFACVPLNKVIHGVSQLAHSLPTMWLRRTSVDSSGMKVSADLAFRKLVHNELEVLNFHHCLVVKALQVSFKLLKLAPPSLYGKHKFSQEIQWCFPLPPSSFPD